jgi:hypothetical protein
MVGLLALPARNLKDTNDLAYFVPRDGERTVLQLRDRINI